MIHRSFEAPLRKMWELWTSPEHFCRWLPPTGATMRFLEANIVEGGTARYEMKTQTGLIMYGRVQYRSMVAPHSLVYTQEFCDEQGNLSRHPPPPLGQPPCSPRSC